jgi:hypothetical protein
MERLMPWYDDGPTTWLAATLDLVLLALLVLLVWRQGADPTAAWRAREERLQEIFTGLRALVAQAEGLARELDGKLAGHAERLRTLVTAAEPRPASAPAAPAHDVAARVQELAARALPVEDIARRLALPVADVRVLVGLAAGRRAEPRPRPAQARA